MAKYIIIQADTNDGDYIQEMSVITDEKLELIQPIITAIKEFKPYDGNVLMAGGGPWKHYTNFPYSEHTRKDLGEKTVQELYGHLGEEVLDAFLNYCPHGEYGFHSIEKIEIIEGELIKLL